MSSSETEVDSPRPSTFKHLQKLAKTDTSSVKPVEDKFDSPSSTCSSEDTQLNDTAASPPEASKRKGGSESCPRNDLQQLLDTITSSVEALQRTCTEKGITIPSLDKPETGAGMGFHGDLEAAEASRTIAAAAFQLTLAVLPPAESLLGLISGHLQTAALRVCLESNVTEILREAGPEGLNIHDISQRADMLASEDKLERILRFLATQHVYKEVKPHFFANTRLSSIMDTGKKAEDLMKHPNAKHDNTNGVPALLGHQFDEVAKASAYLYESLKGTPSEPSSAKTATALNKAFGTEGLDLWAWFGLDTPEQQERKNRFNLGMRGVDAIQKGAICKAYEWKELPEESVIVDVGGGIGTSSIELAKNFPNLQFIVQDLESVVEAGKKASNIPRQQENMISGTLQNLDQDVSGRVTFEVQDFFEEQRTSRDHVAVFLLKQVLHDWCKRCEIEPLPSPLVHGSHNVDTTKWIGG
ncbi:hypothetical protein BKA70DRAFT_1103744 [Coprinopsis sp. MPI-PUGE-AT-0042]|nr:hypothetical protein BKA70DRAFT_1103744 [Coprinopsis sp. MPI-PUGE-AT-0042]